jgi:hypothetical protein
MTLKPIEKRVLSYLDQHGPTHRQSVVHDLASPDSRAAHGYSNGSNGAVPLIMGAWCKRLITAGMVQSITDRAGFYDHHRITAAGQDALRKEAPQA